MAPDPHQRSARQHEADPGREAIELARAEGFAAAGVCAAEPTRWEPELRAWLDAGKHGSMAYLADHLDVRLDPARLLEGASSVLMVADQYAPRGAAEDPPLAPGRGRIARYARGRDYHKVIKRRLHRLCDTLRARHPGHSFRAFTDTAPVLERELAERCGIGWVAKHTLIINPDRGSYLLLGGIVTSLELTPPEDQPRITDHCGTCTRCIDACPTACITPYSVDASRCASYLTIERRLPIDESFHEPIGAWIFGCDVCQEVCPHNAPRRAERSSDRAGAVGPDYAPRRDSFDLLEVLDWTEADRRRAFEGTALKRATLAMMKRNALIAAGNALHVEHLPPLRARIEQIARSETEAEMVRGTARRVLGALDGAEPTGDETP